MATPHRTPDWYAKIPNMTNQTTPPDQSSIEVRGPGRSVAVKIFQGMIRIHLEFGPFPLLSLRCAIGQLDGRHLRRRHANRRAAGRTSQLPPAVPRAKHGTAGRNEDRQIRLCPCVTSQQVVRGMGPVACDEVSGLASRNVVGRRRMIQRTRESSRNRNGIDPLPSQPATIQKRIPNPR